MNLNLKNTKRENNDKIPVNSKGMFGGDEYFLLGVILIPVVVFVVGYFILTPYVDNNKLNKDIPKNKVLNNNQEIEIKLDTEEPGKRATTLDQDDDSAAVVPAKQTEQVLLSRENASVEFCDNLVGATEKSNCYYSLAYDTGDYSLCEHVLTQDICYMEISSKKNDVTICKELNNSKKIDICYNSYAKIKKDATACDKMQVFSSNEQLLNSCYKDVAQLTGDINLCEKVTNKNKQKECIRLGKEYRGEDLNKNSINDSSLNERESTTGADSKYYQDALGGNNVKLCHKIKDHQLRATCYYESALKNRNSDYCDYLIKNVDGVKGLTDKMYDCYARVAGMKNDLTVCDSLMERFSPQTCYVEFAINENDLEACEKITNSTGGRDRCYYSIALTNKDIEICKKIFYVVRRNECIGFIE